MRATISDFIDFAWLILRQPGCEPPGDPLSFQKNGTGLVWKGAQTIVEGWQDDGGMADDKRPRGNPKYDQLKERFKTLFGEFSIRYPLDYVRGFIHVLPQPNGF